MTQSLSLYAVSYWKAEVENAEFDVQAYGGAGAEERLQKRKDQLALRQPRLTKAGQDFIAAKCKLPCECQ